MVLPLNARVSETVYKSRLKLTGVFSRVNIKSVISLTMTSLTFFECDSIIMVCVNVDSKMLSSHRREIDSQSVTLLFLSVSLYVGVSPYSVRYVAFYSCS